MAHHVTQTVGQFGMQLLPHLAGTAATSTPSPLGPISAPILIGRIAPTTIDPNAVQTIPPVRRSSLEAAQAKIYMMLNRAKVPTEDGFYAMMDTAVQPGALVFWSGLGGPTLSSEDGAKAYAAYYNKQLPRPLMQKFDPNYPDRMIFDKFKGVDADTRRALVDMTWSRTSRAFARHVKGRAIVILKGPATNGITWPRNDDCWAKDEYPVLTAQGSACTEILRVDADDWRPGPRDRGLKGEIIWTRAQGVMDPPVDPQ